MIRQNFNQPVELAEGGGIDTEDQLRLPCHHLAIILPPVRQYDVMLRLDAGEVGEAGLIRLLLQYLDELLRTLVFGVQLTPLLDVLDGAVKVPQSRMSPGTPLIGVVVLRVGRDRIVELLDRLLPVARLSLEHPIVDQL